MTTIGEDIFWLNARNLLRDIGMSQLDPAHGAAVTIVRRSLNVRDRPTHHQQAFLENESPALMAYLEKLAGSGDAMGWRTLEERIRLHAEIVGEGEAQPCARPWLAAIWHTLPELAALGQRILDRVAEKNGHTPDVAPAVSDTATGAGGDGDKGSSGKAGTATTNKPRPSSRLALPAIAVTPTPAEEKALDLRDDPEETTTRNEVAPDGPETKNSTAGLKPPGGPK